MILPPARPGTLLARDPKNGRSPPGKCLPDGTISVPPGEPKHPLCRSEATKNDASGTGLEFGLALLMIFLTRVQAFAAARSITGGR